MSVDILGTSWDQCVSMVQYCFTSTETKRESLGRKVQDDHLDRHTTPELCLLIYFCRSLLYNAILCGSRAESQMHSPSWNWQKKMTLWPVFVDQSWHMNDKHNQKPVKSLTNFCQSVFVLTENLRQPIAEYEDLAYVFKGDGNWRHITGPIDRNEAVNTHISFFLSFFLLLLSSSSSLSVSLSLSFPCRDLWSSLLFVQLKLTFKSGWTQTRLSDAILTQSCCDVIDTESVCAALKRSRLQTVLTDITRPRDW